MAASHSQRRGDWLCVIEPLPAAGVPIWIDARARIATMAIDSAVTLTGSMTWTRGAAVNSEDLNLISSPAVASGLHDALARSSHRLLALQSARRLVPGRVGDIVATGQLRRLFWRMADGPDYLVTLSRLRILDALAGPESETPADQHHVRDQERIQRVRSTVVGC